MAIQDPRVDAYIARAAPFARPILEHLRAIVREAVPAADETLKWGMPSHVHAGGIVCMMAAFKQHVSFGFWQHALVMGDVERDGMGSFGKLRSLGDVPPKRQLVALIRKAAKLNEEGVKSAGSRKQGVPKPPPPVPAELAGALARNPAAAAAFKAFAPGQRRDYCEWIADAKRDDTRQRRLAQAIEWIAEGKPRSWKYMQDRAYK
jgi:uncharacterized protein YdeI (YjbR/CyaY-like superfamily)